MNCSLLGIDRLCCSTEDGKLFFYVINPSSTSGVRLDVPSVSTLNPEDSIDGSAHEIPNGSETLLVNQPLTLESLHSLHDLTCYENLTSKFTATVPPCWNEIQQEQQQRRHPQHLHSQTDGIQHTRTWRLQQDRLVIHISLHFVLGGLSVSLSSHRANLSQHFPCFFGM